MSLKNVFGDKYSQSTILFVFIVVLLFVIMPLMSLDSGISGDERVDYKHTGLVLDYFTKGDKAALNQSKTYLHYYGISAQVFARIVTDVFHIKDYYTARHIICSLFGVMTILFTGLIGRSLRGNWCGIVSMLLLLFVPRFLGHSMNNLKDIPFAFGFVFSVYYIIKFFDSYPRLSKKYALLLALGIAFTIGNRAGGLLLIPYLFLYTVFFYLRLVGGLRQVYRLMRYKKVILKIALWVVGISILGYLGSCLLWPYALENPFTAPIESLQVLTKFKVGIKQIFEGKQLLSNLLPKYYAPKYLIITLPLVVIIGVVLYIISCFVKKREISIDEFIIFFSALFPIFWVVFKNSNLYGGIRHLMFVIPFIVLLASFGWFWMYENFNKTKIKWIVVMSFSVLLLFPIFSVYRSYPNHYVYFNEILGGVDKAYGNYELDYYFNSEKQAADWIKENIIKSEEDSLVIATNGRLDDYFRDNKNIKVVYTRYYNKSNIKWDYAVFVNEYIDRYQLLNNLYPIKGTIKTIDVSGKPICSIVKRLSNDDYLGFHLISTKDFYKSKEYLERYLKINPYSEQCWMGMGYLSLMRKEYEESLKYLDKSLSFYPTYLTGLNLKADVLIKLKRYTEAISCCNIILRKKKLLDVVYMKAQAYYGMKQYELAFKQLNIIYKNSDKDYKSLLLGAKILVEVKDYKQALRIFKKIVKNKSNTEILYNIALCYFKINNFELSYKYIDIILNKTKTNLDVLRLKVCVLYNMKKYEESKLLINKLLKQFPNNKDLYKLSKKINNL